MRKRHGKSSGKVMTKLALAQSTHSSTVERGKLIIKMSQGERSFVIIRENDFADIGVALGDSVTEFRVTDSVGQVS